MGRKPLPMMTGDAPPERPPWIRVRFRQGAAYQEVERLVEQAGLHTVCKSAACPNIGECWSRRSLTIMILGNVCTRSCGFCDVITGRPGEVDHDEPRRVAETLATLGLRHTVITSVDRDELPDGGAGLWADTLRAVKARCPEMTVEALIPDFKGDAAALQVVIDAAPEVLSHNMETVERLYRRVRPQASYAQSLELLQRVSRAGTPPHRPTVKSGFMLGLGETAEEIERLLRDLREHGCEIVTIGQYLRPSPKHLPVERFAPPDEFEHWRMVGEALGFQHVASGPLVRSSYHADEHARAVGLLEEEAAPQN
jgi:lipoic acid synthetase